MIIYEHKIDVRRLLGSDEEIPDGSVDMVMADLPYGTTQNKWDSVIPLEILWLEYALPMIREAELYSF